MSLRILHTNDLHGRLTEQKIGSLIVARESCDLYFDSGDCVKTGNLGVPLKPEPVWEMLARAGCDASVIGNRETHVLERAFKAKLASATHPVLCANLVDKDGSRPLPGTLVVEVSGVKVGVFGVSVPMVTAKMRTQAASAYLWEPVIETAQKCVVKLRGQADFVVALTHIGHRSDLQLAELCPGIDVVFGGHSHTVVPNPVLVGSTWVCQGGSHAKYYGVYQWGPGSLTGGLHEWGP